MVKNLKKSDAAKARAKSLTPVERRKIAQKAAQSRWDRKKKIPRASYTGILTIGEMTFPCSVLSDGTRVLTQSDFMSKMGMYYSGRVSSNRTLEDASAQMPHFLLGKNIKPFVDKHFNDLHIITIGYRTEQGQIAHGIKAEIIPRICDVWIDADEADVAGLIKLGSRQKEIAQKAKLLMRALAHVGIIALVDEVTGYQRERASNALVQILEAFIAKELQPWVKTFPDDYYEQLFRLRGLFYPRDKVKRPQYFGYLTNDIIYKRLAPGVLAELKNTTPKNSSGRRKYQLHRGLTTDLGHPRLREHLASVITIMKLSQDYEEFKSKLDMIHPVYGEPLICDSANFLEEGL